MKYNIFLQARIESTRFPKKVIKKILNKTVLEHIVRRLKKVNNVNKIIVVTGSKEKNYELINEIQKLKLDYYCGSEENILERIYQANQKFKADAIIRITADCPLIDFNIINKGINIFESNKHDILSIDRIRTYPDGFDFEIFKSGILKQTRDKKLSEFKNYDEFFKTFISPAKPMLENKKFLQYDLKNDVDYSNIRLTLDYAEDFEFISKIYETLYTTNEFFEFRDILNLLKSNPKLLYINQKYKKNKY